MLVTAAPSAFPFGPSLLLPEGALTDGSLPDRVETMRELTYRGRRVEASGPALASGEWSPRALVWRDRELHHYWLPRPDRPETQRTFGTEGEADAYAEQLARAWIDENS